MSKIRRTAGRPLRRGGFFVDDTASEPVSPPDPLAGIAFASRPAERLARGEGLTAADARAVEPTGVGGDYRKADIEQALALRGGAGRDGE